MPGQVVPRLGHFLMRPPYHPLGILLRLHPGKLVDGSREPRSTTRLPKTCRRIGPRRSMATALKPCATYSNAYPVGHPTITIPN